MTRSDSTVSQRLDVLFRIGGETGANRPGLSDREDDAHRLVRDWMDDAGLETDVDSVGNLYGRLIGTEPALPEVWCGSHLDSVPNGGRFDGALGVVAGLAAITGLRPQRRTITIVAFRDEEGWRFGGGFFGSRGVVGALTDDDYARVDSAGVTIREALMATGRELIASAGWLVRPPGFYLEAHIEQGPALAELAAPVGVVTAIVGIVEMVVTIDGREGHAGTTPMDLRQDAGLCAATFQVKAATVARAIPGAVVTFGTATQLEPGAGNVIARRAVLSLDARAPDQLRLDQLVQGLRSAANQSALTCGCVVSAKVETYIAPIVCADLILEALQRAAPGSPQLPSGAGHDAQILAGAGVPVGMLFVRSRNDGISHSPREHSDAEDIEACVAVLTRALVDLASLS